MEDRVVVGNEQFAMLLKRKPETNWTELLAKISLNRHFQR